MNLFVIGGVRPQFIKIAAFQREIDKYNNVCFTQKINAYYLNSGQHYDFNLSNALIRELGIRFDYTLVHKDRRPIYVLGNMITGIYDALSNVENRPDWVIVFGDTSSTVAGAFASARLGLPIVHIEAGVRSGDLASPEEVHRRIVSHISSVHLCTLRSCVSNLSNEGIVNNVYWTGDLCYEYFMDYANSLPNSINHLANGEYILVTLHKPANLESDKLLINLVNVLEEYQRPSFFVMHPKCQERLEKLSLIKSNKNIHYVLSLPYKDLISAMKGCAFIITDSGGIQRESYYLRKRCLIRRDSLGWLGLVNDGIHHLIGTSIEEIFYGLSWAESAIQTAEYGIWTDEPIRENAGQIALEILHSLYK